MTQTTKDAIYVVNNLNIPHKVKEYDYYVSLGSALLIHRSHSKYFDLFKFSLLDRYKYCLLSSEIDVQVI